MDAAADALDSAQLEKILHGVRIPPQPKLLLDLKEEQSKPNPNVNKICTLISKDVALAAAVLKTINSPFYGMKRKVDSVQRAVVLLGMGNVTNLVRAFTLQSTLGTKNVSLERFWDTASDVANACVALASRFMFPNPDDYYTLGLFHDCGIAVMAQKYPDYKETLKRGNALVDRLVTDAEDAVYNTNHTVVGYYMAKSWNLSEPICRVIEQHHDFAKVFAADETDPLPAQMMAVLKAAGNISHSARRLAEDHEWLRTKDAVCKILNLDATEYDDLRDDVAEMLAAA